MTKKVWITGASSGIGKALSIKFAKEGWQVAASARRENLLNDLQKNHSNIYSFPLDVTDLENSKKVFKKIIDQLSEINLCIFSTGTYDPKTEKEINVCLKSINKNKAIAPDGISNFWIKDNSNNTEFFKNFWEIEFIKNIHESFEVRLILLNKAFPEIPDST